MLDTITNNPNLLFQEGWGNLFLYKNMTIAVYRLYHYT